MDERFKFFVRGVCILCCGAVLSDAQGTKIKFQVERVETDLILFRMGTNIDYSYNETAEFTGEIVSSPGCPKSHEGRPWVYYGRPPKCYLVGFHGPCPYGKRLFSVPNSKYGVCNCECFTKEIKSHPRPQNPILSISEIIDYNVNDIANNLVLYPRRRARSHGNQSSSRNNSVPRMINSSSLSSPWKMEGRRRCNKTSVTTTATSTRIDIDGDKEISNYNLPSQSSSHIAADSKDRYSFCYSEWHKRQVVYDSLRQECAPFLDQGPCHSGEWLVRDLERENGVTCEKRKCPETEGVNVKPEYGGTYTYFDYRRQACFTEVYGNLQESFFANVGAIIPGSNIRFCRDAGLKYSQRLKTCVRDTARQYQYKVVG